jgi:tetratricopeptide (TPR) repeat protein
MNSSPNLLITQLLNTGCQLHMAGQLEEAFSIYHQVLGKEPRNAEANYLLGTLVYQTGDVSMAQKLIGNAIRIDPSKPEYHNNLGLVLQAVGNNQKAAHSFRRAIKLNSEFSDAINNLGIILKNEGDADQAEKMFRDALRLQPNFIESWNNLGGVLEEKGSTNEAIECYKISIKISPEIALTHYNLGIAYKKAGQSDAALASYNCAVLLDPNLSQVHQNVGVIFQELGRFDEAIACFRKALDINPESIEALYSLSLSRKFDAYTDDVQMMENIFLKSETSTFNKIQLGFGLGKIYEDLKNYEKAFTYIDQANLLKRQTYFYNVDADVQIFKSIAETFNNTFFESRNGYGIEDRSPIFIIGMPRSGTSLMEQILSNHPDIHGAGELPDLPNICFSHGKIIDSAFTDKTAGLNAENFRDMALKYVSVLRSHSSQSPHVTDKMPENYYYVGMIKLMMPNAKIVHCQRDAMDTCLSNLKNNFEIDTLYAYDQKELGTYHLAYAELMAHWNKILPGFILNIQYEDLVSSPEQMIRKILDYCGLEYSGDCLNFHKSTRIVRTASLYQVRQPMYKSSVKSWQHYERQLEPLRGILEGAK